MMAKKEPTLHSMNLDRLERKTKKATELLVETAETATVWEYFRVLVETFHSGINPKDIDRILAAIDKRIAAEVPA